MGFFGRRGKSDEDIPADDDAQPVSEKAIVEVEAADEADDMPDEKPPEKPKPDNRMFDTALGAGSSMEGSLSSDGNVRLDGRFKGTLAITGNVLVGVTADIEADINGKNVTVAGVVRGNVSGGKVHVLATANITGDIRADSLITEDGAFIDGRVTMNRSTPSKPLPPITEDELS